MIFPEDHGAHQDYQLEWWYYTGNLWDESGRRYGYQVTFFRVGVRGEPSGSSVWAVRDLFIAHLALTDVESRRHRCWERIRRAGPGWAGAEPLGSRVWNGDWQLKMEHDESGLRTRHSLSIQVDDVALELTLTPSKPLVLHGERGLSRKGSVLGNASYYYSFTRLATTGTLQVGERQLRVTGESWMDHEFSSSFLQEDQSGWDWFCLQLDNGCELMLYQMRRTSGEPDPASSGTIVFANGDYQTLRSNECRWEGRRVWTSPRTKGQYPLEWHIAIPHLAVQLAVRAAVDDQEMDTRRSTGIAYWEGCVDVTGSMAGRPVAGHGYLEMTGRTPTPLRTGNRLLR